MSLNYYAKQVRVLAEIDAKEQSIVDELRSLSKNTSIELTSIELDDVIFDYFKNMRDSVEDIHIGLFSNGWRFLFNHNDWKYFNSRDTLIEWLDTVEIQSEYGDVISTKDFMDMVNSCEDGKQALNYILHNPKAYEHRNGLRFSKVTDFC